MKPLRVEVPTSIGVGRQVNRSIVDRQDRAAGDRMIHADVLLVAELGLTLMPNPSRRHPCVDLAAHPLRRHKVQPGIYSLVYLLGPARQ